MEERKEKEPREIHVEKRIKRRKNECGGSVSGDVLFKEVSPRLMSLV